MLGLAVLAKGLVPLALAAPLALRVRWLRDLLRWRVRCRSCWWLLPGTCCATCATAGHLSRSFSCGITSERFTSGALLHTQPWWFYLARFPALMLPWAPLLLLPLTPGRRLVSGAAAAVPAGVVRIRIGPVLGVGEQAARLRAAAASGGGGAGGSGARRNGRCAGVAAGLRRAADRIPHRGALCYPRRWRMNGRRRRVRRFIGHGWRRQSPLPRHGYWNRAGDGWRPS